MRNRHGQMDQDLYVGEMNQGLKKAEVVITMLINCLEDLVDYDDKRFDDYRLPLNRAKRWLKEYE